MRAKTVEKRGGIATGHPQRRCASCEDMASPHATRCVACSEAQKDVYWSRVKEGLCVTCGGAARPQNRRCAHCADTESASYQERYATRKRQAVCVRCGRRPAFLDHVVCPACYQQAKRYQARVKRRKQLVEVAK